MKELDIKNKIYDNYVIYHPDGRLLSYVNKSRIKWFLKKGLAIQINEYSIKLTFEPNLADKNSVNIFKKENICVKCGGDNKLTKHHVVPYCYVKHMDELTKGRNVYSVVVLCRDCHNEYEEEASKLKSKILEDYDFSNMRQIDLALKDVINLQRHIDKIPGDKFEKMILNIETTFKISLKNKKDLQNILSSYSNQRSETFFTYEVVKKITENNELEKFMIMWRKHFFTQVNPQFMPEGWKYMCENLSINFEIKTPYLRCI